MIVWSSRKLEDALAQNQLDSWTKAKYLIVPAIIGTLLGGPIYLIRPVYGEKAPVQDSLWILFFSIITAFLTYYGIKKFYKTNKELDDSGFFERMVILSLPIFLKILIISIVLSISLIRAALLMQIPQWFPRPGILVSILTPIMTFVFYRLLNNSLSRFGRLLNGEELPKLSKYT